MWHLQTKIGTFWILDDNEAEQDTYLLGMNNDVLGRYTDPEVAAEDVRKHETGCLLWDENASARPAPEFQGWREGPPEAWDE